MNGKAINFFHFDFLMCTQSIKKGIAFVYNRKWRNPENLEIPKNVKPVIRFKSKISGNTLIKDLVQGEINISNSIISSPKKEKLLRFGVKFILYFIGLIVFGRVLALVLVIIFF